MTSIKIFRKSAGIERRWVLNSVALVIALVIVFVAIFSISFAAYSYSNVRADLEERAERTAEYFKGYTDRSYDEYYEACIRFAENFEEKDGLQLQFVSVDGQVVASALPKGEAELLGADDVAQALAGGEIASFCGRNSRAGEKIMAVSGPMIYSDGEVVGVMRYVTSMEDIDMKIGMSVCVAALIGIFVISFVLFSSKFFIRFILDPVSEITVTAKRIAAGSYGATVQKRRDDEIGELADTINEISAQISQTEKMQTEFISSVSHELRTPLTAITGWGETLLAADEMDAEETRRGMAIILREARRLTGMVEELLEFTRMQDGRFTLNMEMTDILSEFEDTFFMYGSRLRQEGMELDYMESQDEIPEILCDASRLRQVFLNILDNAAKHGGEGKKITASIGKTDDHVMVQIRDYGPGIPEEELPHIKLKFYKGSSKARGNGIGLAVCEEIVTMHGGELTLENAEGGGTLVTVRIPASQ